MLVHARESFQRELGHGQLITVHVPHDLVHFIGHFPDEPILPALAQLELLVLDETALRWPELTAPLELLRLKWMAPIRPGDALRVELLRPIAKLQVEFVISRDAVICAQGTVVFNLQT